MTAQLRDVASFNRRSLLTPHLLESVSTLNHPGDNYVLAAELVWSALHAQAAKQSHQDDNVLAGDHDRPGHTVTGMGVRQAIELLWPATHRSEVDRASVAIRRHLAAGNNAQCLQQAKGAPHTNLGVILAEWWVADEWCAPSPSKPAPSKPAAAKPAIAKPAAAKPTPSKPAAAKHHDIDAMVDEWIKEHEDDVDNADDPLVFALMDFMHAVLAERRKYQAENKDLRTRLEAIKNAIG